MGGQAAVAACTAGIDCTQAVLAAGATGCLACLNGLKKLINGDGNPNQSKSAACHKSSASCHGAAKHHVLASATSHGPASSSSPVVGSKAVVVSKNISLVASHASVHSFALGSVIA